jgi:hypothetical protein
MCCLLVSRLTSPPNKDDIYFRDLTQGQIHLQIAPKVKRGLDISQFPEFTTRLSAGI